MKYFTFLFLFLFPLATSVDFPVTIELGIHIYEISENWNTDPIYEKFDCVQWYTSTPTDIPVLDSCNTYIILEIQNLNEIYLFYWLGAQSSEEKRINTAHSVGYIFNDEILSIKRGIHGTGLRVRSFQRVTEGAERSKFRALFKLPKYITNENKLYRVTGSRGQFIMEVPLMYHELNGSDSFVLAKYSKVFIWNSYHSNEYKEQQAVALGTRILDHDKNLQSSISNFFVVTESDRNIDPQFYRNFRKEFLKVLEGVPKSIQFPQNQVNYSDIELEIERKKKLVLYEYGWFLKHVVKHEVEWEVLTMETFKDFNTYVLVDFHNGNIFPIIGSYVHTEQIKIALSDAEQFSITNGVFQRVKIIRKRVKLHTNFIIYLQDGLLQPWSMVF